MDISEIAVAMDLLIIMAIDVNEHHTFSQKTICMPAIDPNNYTGRPMHAPAKLAQIINKIHNMLCWSLGFNGIS
jgi:hypothetical protein